MSDKLPRPESSEAKAAAATRRRWITLGEVLAVIAICISALTLYNNWTERSESDAVKHADAQQASTRAATLVLSATPSGEDKLILKPAKADQSVQSQQVLFPTALALAPAETTGEPRIEASWFAHALKNARGLAHLPDDSRSDERLPVAITTHFLVDGDPHDDVAIYDIGYSISGHWLGGHTVILHGVSLVARVKSTTAQARLDARWNKLFSRQK